MAVEVPFPCVPAPLADTMVARGFTELTAVQEAVLDPDLAGCDLRISSQTGSGKTVAIGFILAKVVTEAGSYRDRTARPAVAIIAPTRELAAQLGRELGWLFAGQGVSSAVVTGGTPIRDDFRALAASPALVIGTPGRLADHLERGSLDLGRIRAVVLDEADEMLDMGFRDEIEAIVERTPAERETHLVSATFPPAVRQLADRYQRDPVRVEGTRAGRAHTDISHVAHVVREGDKPAALINTLLAASGQRTLVFVRTRLATQQVASALGNNGFSAQALSGDMSQRDRNAALQAFRDGATAILVATDVAARGLDVEDVSFVVHYDMPEMASSYTHRSGRTGRAGRKGTSVALLTPRERRRADAVFSRAKVKVSWEPVASREMIRERAHARLSQDLDRAAGDERLLALAKSLLERRDAADVVAKLLARTRFEGPCDAREVAACSGGPSHDRAGASARRPGRANGARSRGPVLRASSGYRPYHVSWGASGGANAKRLLAMVCRRGGVRGEHIGAIRVADHSAVVEVSAQVAGVFERNVQRPDPRNPKIRIRPWQDAPGHERARHRARDAG